MTSLIRHFRFLMLGLILLPLSACALTYSAEPIEAWVVDAETKEPLEGVIVTANWQLEEGTLGGNVLVGQLMVMEAVTDKEGKFTFPGWGPKLALTAHLVNRDPQLLLFKSEYEYRALQNTFTVDYNKGSLRRSEWNGKTIEMKKFKGSSEEYVKHLGFLSTSLETIISDEDCNWKKIPRMLLAIKTQTDIFRKEGVRESLISADYVRTNQQKCGSPSEFFRSYQQ